GLWQPSGVVTIQTHARVLHQLSFAWQASWVRSSACSSVILTTLRTHKDARQGYAIADVRQAGILSL
ncbi:hypothetical protein M9458_044169, partial [Cirrhinus mrigala]